MRTLLLAYLLGSAAMSVVAIGFLALLPLLKRRASARSLYAALLLIVAGFAVPLRPHTSAPFTVRPLPVVLGAPSPVEHASGAGVTLVNAMEAEPRDDTMPNEAISTARQTDVRAEATGPATPVWLPGALCAIWACGAAAVIGWHAVRHLRFLRTVRRWREPVRNAAALLLFESLKRELGVLRPVALMVCAPAAGPMLTGLIRPVVLLPNTALDPEVLALVLRHELVHLKRRDLWAKALVLFTMALHWFNPILYLVVRVLSLQCEIACDAAVLKNTGAEERRRYGEAIIGLIRGNPACRTALSTTFYGGIHDMKQRLTALMDMSRKRLGTLTLLAVLLLTLLTGAAFATESPAAGAPSITTVGKTGADSAPPTAEAVEAESRSDLLTAEDGLARYASFGLARDAHSGRITFQGKWVRMFENFDADGNGGVYCDADGGEIDVYKVYDAHGALTGLGVYSRAAFEARTAQWQAAIATPSSLWATTDATQITESVSTVQQIGDTLMITVTEDVPAHTADAISTTVGGYVQDWHASAETGAAMNGWYVRDWSVGDIRADEDAATATIYITMDSADGAKPVTVGQTATLHKENGAWVLKNGMPTPGEAAQAAESVAVSSAPARQASASASTWSASAVQAGSHNVASASQAFETQQSYRDELAVLYAEYEPFGLTYDKATDTLAYGGLPVRFFLDVLSSNGNPPDSANFHGSMRTFSVETGEIDVYAVRDADGSLTAVLPYGQAEFDRRTAEETAYVTIVGPQK